MGSLRLEIVVGTGVGKMEWLESVSRTTRISDPAFIVYDRKSIGKSLMLVVEFKSDSTDLERVELAGLLPNAFSAAEMPFHV